MTTGEQGREGGPEGPKSVIRSEELFQGAREVMIIHNEDRYRLLITKSGKLILNK
ncbi:MAG: hemin uptake protein HemP [Candidatus Omnitrophica bacterium]|nr:hemin uptake protein HemP [Candidatus Omnitrophota bacterium]